MTSQNEELKRQIAHAENIRRVTEDPVFKEMFDRLKSSTFAKFVDSKAEDDEIRKEAWRTMNCLEKIQQYFEDGLKSGMLSEIDLTHEKID